MDASVHARALATDDRHRSRSRAGGALVTAMHTRYGKAHPRRELTSESKQKKHVSRLTYHARPDSHSQKARGARQLRLAVSLGSVSRTEVPPYWQAVRMEMKHVLSFSKTVVWRRSHL